jgi:hypothetical protein
MFRFIQVKVIFAFTVLVIGLGLSCSDARPPTPQKKEVTPTEILSYFLKRKLGDKQIDGNYFFICRGFCKGCVHQTLLSLDSLYLTSEWGKEWTIFTSSEYVKNIPLQNIKIIYDKEWDKVNYVFNDVTYVKFINDSIVISQTIDSKNLKILK